MIADMPGLMDEIRTRFAHVESCPFEGPRIFFENAGGALHLKSVAETSAFHASLPDNPGRVNGAGQALQRVIETGKADMALFFNAPGGQVFVGESGTELLFRLVRTAALGAAPGGVMIGSTLEHPATASARARWAGITGRELIRVPHDDATGTVTAEAYRAHLTPDIRVATILHTSPVTGMAVEVGAIAAAIREVAPEALIVVDGIQHASHGAVDVAALGVDGYAVSPYKMFSRHGYGVAWASDRLTACGKDNLADGPADNWELGTRDAGAYATFSDVVAYLDWLGGQFTDSADRRARLEAAGRAIKAHEARLTKAALKGTGNLPGLGAMAGITLVGGGAVEGREGVVSFRLAGWDSADLVEHLRRNGIRVHTRKADHYSGNVLVPLGMADCVRLSFCHYNTEAEVARFLSVMQALAA
ncbi:aminotransferase class V-fold PLP-dependent enzyme [Rhodovulum euryhalinum]|uniref:Selenocysteine lyase/cysteine desulfurase n=1 Tax=Rhodovulum euryhalinum TaxID=35805 RepID=A0A4V2SAT0_9RHOB|nr:aminotransferase class V-fold PLP-dependent enzyme [Rhodovulum euryhalinum]TCO72830.1 selenocysteine lyase/cysteine desulfurase [Rhodovulum euryhalinum]